MDSRRYELASQGFDDFLELVGGDGSGSPEATGLRVPAAPGLRYRFLCAVGDMSAGDEIIGLRQYLELWSLLPTTVDEQPQPPIYPFRFPVATPLWHFVDGFTTWTLTSESVPPPDHKFNASESRSFAFQDSQTPALVFESVGFPLAPPEPGYLGLNAYTAPGIRGTSILTWRDLRYPWQRTENAREALCIRAPGNRRVRLYCDVLQTDPSTRYQPTVPSGAVLCPEDGFTFNPPGQAAIYGVVAGAIDFRRRKGRKR